MGEGVDVYTYPSPSFPPVKPNDARSFESWYLEECVNRWQGKRWMTSVWSPTCWKPDEAYCYGTALGADDLKAMHIISAAFDSEEAYLADPLLPVPRRKAPLPTLSPF